MAVTQITESGRPCGCDPAANHPCEGHANYRDATRTTITGTAPRSRVPVLADVSGPDEDGDISIQIGAGEIEFLPRFVAERFALEILRRLEGRS